MASPHHVLLVPGFFGFANLGDFVYFGHVRDLLAQFGPALGVRGEVRVVHTVPTASLRRRAALLAEEVSRVLDERGGVVSIVGHSSGGLDARLVATREASLPTEVDVERCARAIRAVVTVATPHHGTPVAEFFNGLLGQQLLKLLSISTMYTIRAGRLPIRAALRIARVFRRPRAHPGHLVAQVAGQLLADFESDRRRQIEEFLDRVGTERDLLAQITPAAMDVFNASAQDRPGVRYGCVVAQARPPGIRSALSSGIDPYAQATHALYVGLHRIAARYPLDRAPRLGRAQADALRSAYGRIPDRKANDGMVPTLSQVWGNVVAAAWADHHDVIGHFHRPHHVPPHFDWLTSGTGFDRIHFERVWREVAAFVAAAAR
jgi:hypothetical protein